MAYNLIEVVYTHDVAEREYVKNVSLFESSPINSCVCLISQTGDSTLTAVHLSAHSEDGTFINDVASEVVANLHTIFGSVDSIHVLGAIQCWRGYVFWTELQRFYDLQFSNHEEGTCYAEFEGSVMKYGFRHKACRQ